MATASARARETRATEGRGGALAWCVLVALLAALTLAAATHHRRDWPGFVGDETTYLSIAESLAFDLDLLYTRADYERFVDHWGAPPEGIILQSGDRGTTITYGKPFFYGIYLAPFVRLAPRQGPFVANALLVALAALATARALRPRLGPSAPLWIAAWIFGSVTFAYTFWVHSDIFLVGCGALAFALLVGRDEEGPGTGATALAGALLAMVVFSRPVYAPLLLPAIVAVARRRRALLVLVLAAAAVIVGAALVHRALAGSWTGYGAERRGFYAHTGFPDVDFPAVTEWKSTLERFPNNAWRTGLGNLVREKKVDLALWRHDAVAFLIGRNVGVLPYFLPLLLGFFAAPRGLLRWSLVGAVLLGVVALFYLRPFNFYGGGGAIANRYFLALYPALWFLPTRRRSALWPLLLTLAAAPFLLDLWRAPRAFPLGDDGGLRWVAAAADVLPPETTQSHLKPGGRDDIVHGGTLWLRFLTPSVGHDPVRDALLLVPGTHGEILVGSPTPLTALAVRRLDGDGPALQVGGAAHGVVAAGADPTPLRLGSATAVHPMWWTWDRYHLYRLELSAGPAAEAHPAPLALQLVVPAP